MNTIGNWQTIARVHNPERVKWWQEIFDGDTCPVVSIVPALGNFPEAGEQRFYSLDLKAISAEQRQRLVKSIADKFNQSVGYVEANIDLIGVPILARDVVVSSSDPRTMAAFL